MAMAMKVWTRRCVHRWPAKRVRDRAEPTGDLGLTLFRARRCRKGRPPPEHRDDEQFGAGARKDKGRPRLNGPTRRPKAAIGDGEKMTAASTPIAA